LSIQGIFYVAAHVSNLARSKQFYSEKLGWKLETNEPTVAGFRFGTGYLVLLAEPADAGSKVTPGEMHISVLVTDIEAEYAKLQEAGVKVGDLRSQPWGEKNFSFHDPDGYEWSYGESRGG
jgi:catechol 2,3-dioxygenase-like lactoylglutathione lyase family enzyme